MNIYAEKREQMLTRCTCGELVVFRARRDTGETIALEEHPSEGGEWQADAEGRAYRSQYPVHSYRQHQCEE